MAIKASDLRKSAEGDPAALQQGHAPDVRIGGDLVVGNDLAVPAGHTWQINGNVKIEDGAEIRIEDGATLAITGIDTDRAVGESDFQPLIKRLTAPLSHQATGGDGQQQRLRAQIDHPLLLSPDEAMRVAAQFTSGIQIDHPLLLSPDEAMRMAAQFTSGIAPAAIGEYAIELARPPRWLLGESWAEYQTSWAESIRQALEPAALGVAFQAQAAASEAFRQALGSSALHMMNEALEMLSGQGKAIAESFASWAQPFDLSIARGALSGLQLARGALDDLSTVQNVLRNGGYSLGMLDDTNRAIERLYEWRQASPVRQPPAERVQVVHMEDEALLAELDRRLRSNSLSSEAKRSVARLLQAYTGRGKPGPQEPPMETKIALVEEWERLKAKKGVSQTAYVAHHAAKIYAVGLRAFQGYCKEVRLWRKVNSDFQ